MFSRSFCSKCFPVPFRISWLTLGVSETMLFHCQIFVYFPNLLLLPLLIPIQLLIPSSPGDTLRMASAPWDLLRLVLRPGASRGTLCVVSTCVGWASGGSAVTLESPVCWPAFCLFRDVVAVVAGCAVSPLSARVLLPASLRVSSLRARNWSAPYPQGLVAPGAQPVMVRPALPRAP